jgi:hypothetical protein
MLKIIDGLIVDPRVKVDLCPLLDHGALVEVHAIVMHQTGGSTAAGALSKYKMINSKDHTGAHFLLDKDGTMYQTLQITRRCAHVAPIKSRCLAEMRCSTEDLKEYADIKKKLGSGGEANRAIGAYEAKKQYPDRYPFNPDAIGIEAVGLAPGNPPVYENPTSQQNASIHWFVPELLLTLHLTASDVCRHPMLSAKTDSEAAGITW